MKNYLKNSITIISILSLAILLSGCGGKGKGSLFLSEDQGLNFFAQSQFNTEDSLDGEQVLSLASNPKKPQKVMAGLVEKGLIISEDGGKSWRSTNLSSGSVNKLNYDVDGSALYMAVDKQVLRTLDNGQTFENLYADPTVVNVLAIDPAARSNLWLGTEAGQVLKSTNGGKSWSVAKTFKQPISALLISPLGSAIFVGTRGDGIYVSSDKGKTFAERTPSNKDAGGYNLSVDNVIALSQSAQAGSALLMATPDNLFKSNDLGKSWDLIENPLASSESQLNGLLASRESGSFIITVANNNVAISRDGGNSWTTRSVDSDRVLGAIAFVGKTDILVGISSAGKGFIEESLK